MDKTSVIGARSCDGKVTRKVIDDTTITTINAFLAETLLQDALLITDEHKSYKNWAKHESVNHSAGEYVNQMIYPHRIKSVWTVLKRDLIGIYLKYLQGYVSKFSEFTFRLSHCKDNLEQRMLGLIDNLIGARIDYQTLIELV